MIEAFSGRHWPNWFQDCSNNAKIKTKTRCPQKPLSKLDSNIQIWNVSIFEVRLTGIYILSLTFTIRCINRRDHSMNADWSKGLTESCRNISSVHWLHRDTKRRFSVRFEEKSLSVWNLPIAMKYYQGHPKSKSKRIFFHALSNWYTSYLNGSI